MIKKARSHKLTVTVIVLIAGAVAGWRYWDKQLRDKIIPRQFAAVEQGQVYRSGCIHPRLIRKVIEENDIEVIVSLMGQYRPEEAAARELGIELKQYRLDGDGGGDIVLYANAIEHIVRAKEQGKPVLVHCSAGTMRTGAAVAFYRMLVLGQRDNGRIVGEMKKHGWKTRKIHLPDYINRHMYALAAILKDRGVIDKIPNPIPQIESRGATIYTIEELQRTDSVFGKDS
jgi:hypothetical protein